jgi:peptide/nickel transport system permease protein
MISYIVQRLVSLIPVLFCMSIIVFAFLHLVPGDPVNAILGNEADPVARAALRQKLGLDQPLIVQYFRWLWHVLQGDFGRSIRAQQEVRNMILEKLPATLLLTLASACVAILISLPAGIIAAANRNTLLDFFSMVFALLGLSIPSFWLGIMLILIFALSLGWFPTIGYVSFFSNPWEALRHLVLPALTLGAGMAGSLTRMVRAEMLEQLGQDYVRTARAKGVWEQAVLYKHTLKNSLIPALTVIGLQCGTLLGGAVITEQIFAWPGVGQLAIHAIYGRDYPVVQGVVLVLAGLFVLVNLCIDLLYTVLDPRIRLAGKGV